MELLVNAAVKDGFDCVLSVVVYVRVGELYMSFFIARLAGQGLVINGVEQLWVEDIVSSHP